MVISKSIALPPGRGYAAAAIADSLAEQYLSLGSLTLRALTHAAQGQDPQALEDFQRAIAAEEPTDTAGSAQTRVFLGRFYAQRGDYKTAQGLYREALEIVPDYPLVHLQMAELATIKGQYRTAKYHYQAVGGPIALHGLARLQALQGRPADEAWDSAEQELRRTIAGNAFGHRCDLAHLLLERGDPADREEAVALMEAESAQRRDAQTLDLLAWALMEAGRWPEAQQVVREALDHGVRNADLAYRAGDIAAARQDPEQAEQFFRLAMAFNPTFSPQTWQRLGLIPQN